MSIAFIQYRWDSSGGQPTPEGPWQPETVEQVFASDANGWSVASYWKDCSFGLLDPSFNVSIPLSSPPAPGAPAGWHEWNHVRGPGGGSRKADLGAGITQAYVDGLPQGTYDHFVIFVDPPPSDAGALDLQDALLDEGATLSFFQHEIGHLLGLNHPWGAEGEYDDPYCVMGFANVNTFTLTPPQPVADLPLGSVVWTASRRPATATLYRYVPAFRASTSVQHVYPWSLATQPAVIGGPSECELVAPGDATLDVDPLLVAVVVEPPASPAGAPGELLLEYRRPKAEDWDRAIGDPVVVIHSLRLARHQARDAVFFEDRLGVSIGAGWVDPELDVGVEVVDRSDDQSRIRIRVAGARSMEAAAWIDSLTLVQRTSVQVDEGMTTPEPIGDCVFGEYPYTVDGTRAELLLRPAVVGIDAATIAWSVVGKYPEPLNALLTGALETDLQTKRIVSRDRIRGGVHVPSTVAVTLGYRLGSDGSLLLRKSESDGAFVLHVRLSVEGTNARFGEVERHDRFDVHFPGDELTIGGTYRLDRDRCSGHLRPFDGFMRRRYVGRRFDPRPRRQPMSNVLQRGPSLSASPGEHPQADAKGDRRATSS